MKNTRTTSTIPAKALRREVSRKEPPLKTSKFSLYFSGSCVPACHYQSYYWHYLHTQKISHFVASLPTSPQQVVFALLVPSFQQVWNKMLTTILLTSSVRLTSISTKRHRINFWPSGNESCNPLNRSTINLWSNNPFDNYVIWPGSLALMNREPITLRNLLKRVYWFDHSLSKGRWLCNSLEWQYSSLSTLANVYS
jgi:hypothetical protein